MIRSLLVRAGARTSTRLFYSVWSRSSALTLVLSGAAAFVGVPTVAETGLILILILLLGSGVLLLVLGIRDLVRDFRHRLPHAR